MIKKNLLSSVFHSILLALFFFGAVEVRAGQRVPLPEGVFYYKSASNVYGFESAWINPAGLGGFTGTGVMVMTDYFGGNILDSYGILVNGKQSAFAFRRVDNPIGTDYKEMVYASGLGLGSVKIGGSYRYFKEGPGIYENRHFWNIGLQMQGDSKLSAAMVFSNLNRGRVDGKRSLAEQRYSVSYRPFKFDMTISADLLRTSQFKIGNGHMIYNVIVTPHPGLTFSGYLDSDDNFNFGVRANLLEYFVGNESRFNSQGAGAVQLSMPVLLI